MMRWVWVFYRAACAICAVVLAGLLVLIGPLAAAIVLALPSKVDKALGFAAIGLLVAAIRGLMLEAIRDPHDPLVPRGPWRECENPTCRAPIASSSRALYCSAACRKIVRMRLERDAITDEVPF